MSANIMLYLKKDEVTNNDIFIESTINQLQIEGIRFLFKQYQRKIPGVILNNTENYDNSLQVALFLCAIRNTKEILDKPILIVCDENKEYDWLDHFQKQTHSFDAVVVAATNPFLKKSIFINTMEGINTFTRRNWSVMVVDNNTFLKEKLLLSKFNADYKIWITSLDIKENLKTLDIIYKWIFPKGKFCIDDFQAKPGDKDSISKAILLETFMEDFVFRIRTGPSSLNKISIKNKDATGTKVKRSKRTIEEVGTNNNENNIGPGVGAIKLSKINDNNTFIDRDSLSLSNFNNSKILSEVGSTSTAVADDKQSDEDIESFIRDKQPIKCDSFNDYIVDYDDVLGNNQEEKQKEFFNEKSISSLDENQGDCCVESDTNSYTLTHKNKSRKSKFTILSDSDDDGAYELETQKLCDDNTNNETRNNPHDRNSVTSKISSDKVELLENDIEIEQKETINQMDVDDVMVLETKTNGNMSTQHTVFSKEPEDNVNMNICLEENGDNNEAGEDINDKDNNINENIKTEASQIANKTLDIESKVTEHEDRIFKKFKGTFLDSIF